MSRWGLGSARGAGRGAVAGDTKLRRNQWLLTIATRPLELVAQETQTRTSTLARQGHMSFCCLSDIDSR